MIDLRQLRQFVAVAEELSFRRAAQRLHMSQPPLSQAIRGLAEELGTALFNRTRRKVGLTQPGRVLLDEAHRVLSQMERALAAARGAARGMTGRLAVGFVHSSTYEILPAILRRFRVRPRRWTCTSRSSTRSSRPTPSCSAGSTWRSIARRPSSPPGWRRRRWCASD